VSEQDPLSDRFTAFRRYSVETTNPPGVAVIRRTVFRRRARNSAVVAIIAAVLVLSMVWPVWSHRPVEPAITPSPSGTVSPSGSGSGSPAAPPAGSAPTSAGSSASSSRSTRCLLGADERGDLNPFVGGGSTYSVTPPDYFVRCPNNRLRVYTATYRWDRSRQQLVLYSSQEVTLTAARPTAKALVPAEPTGATCGYIYYTVQSGKAVPATIPVSVQDGADRDHYIYFQAQGVIITYFWDTQPSTTLKQYPDCAPPSPSPSPSPT
jgi:hypothetical protein